MTSGPSALGDSGPIVSGAVGATDDDEAYESLLNESTAVAAGVALKAATPIARGSVIADRYQIEQRLGEGGSGTVYRAWDRILGELVAVKVLHPERAREKSWIKRLAREVRVARAIRHPNVCRVFELGHAGGHWFVTMELAPGGSLRAELRSSESEDVSSSGGSAARTPVERKGHGAETTRAVPARTTTAKRVASAPAGPLRPLAERLRDIRGLCAGLGAIHAVGITHRDVTPQNVLRMGDGRLILTDFGLAIERQDQTTVHGGTPAYMPPEAVRGERSDQRSDVYQVGLIMHEILTGTRATYDVATNAVVVAEAPPKATPAEEELLRLIAECLNTDPARRPPSAVAVAGRVAAAEAARPASWPLRLTAKARRFQRRHVRLLRVAAVVVAAAGLVRVVQVASRPALCRGAEDQLAGVWDGARSTAVERSFSASRKGFAADTFARVRRMLDDYSTAWKRMYTDACEATHTRGEQSAEVLDLRMSCLHEDRSDLKALVDMLSRADGETVRTAVNAASGLASVARCADVPVLRQVVRPPQDREVRARVGALRDQLAEVNALHGGGRYADAVARARPLVAEARAIGYGPVLAEALYAEGRSASFLRFDPTQADRAAVVLDEAMLVAEAARHDRVLAEAGVMRASLLAMQGKYKELDRFLPRANAVIGRLGGDARLEGWLATAQGWSLQQRHRFAESLALHEKALALKRQALGDSHWDVALSLGNIANELHEMGRNEEALRANERTIAILEAALGPQHPEVARHVANRGEIRLALGQPKEARADFEWAIHIMEQAFSADYPDLVPPLKGLGQAILKIPGARAAEAVAALERAQSLATGDEFLPVERAEIDFTLARALWADGRHPERARLLAERAMAALAPDDDKLRPKVAAALAAAASDARTIPAPTRPASARPFRRRPPSGR